MVKTVTSEEKTQYAIELLAAKHLELGRLPKKDDFSPDTVCFIKQKLGPWSRALEAAGLKEPQTVTAKEKSRAKRERSRKNRKVAKKSAEINISGNGTGGNKNE